MLMMLRGAKLSNYLTDAMHIKFEPEELITSDDLVSKIINKIYKREPFYINRIGDGELIIMSQDILLSQEFIRKDVKWSVSTNYCGVSTPNIEMRDKLIESIKQADYVGVFPNDDFTIRMFSALDYKPNKLCYAFVNVGLCYNKHFVNLIKSNPPLLVGSLSELFAEYLYKELGVSVKGYYKTIRNPDNIQSTIDYMRSVEHDWSLVSAGVNAKIISNIMAKQYGKVCIDYGQGMDTLLDVHNKYNGRYFLNKG